MAYTKETLVRLGFFEVPMKGAHGLRVRNTNAAV
jgi:hypothetical protein